MRWTAVIVRAAPAVPSVPAGSSRGERLEAFRRADEEVSRELRRRLGDAQVEYLASGRNWLVHRAGPRTPDSTSELSALIADLQLRVSPDAEFFPE